MDTIDIIEIVEGKKYIWTCIDCNSKNEFTSKENYDRIFAKILKCQYCEKEFEVNNLKIGY